MEPLLDVSVCVQPRPQQRARFCKRTGLAHDPSARDKKLFMQCLRAAAEDGGINLPDAVSRGQAVSISVEYVYERPASHYKGSNKDGLRRLKASAPEHKTTKPDTDNLLKLTLDAMQPSLLQDDDVVVELSGLKRWAQQHENAGVRVVMKPYAAA